MSAVEKWIDSLFHETWVWFHRLSQEEWMALLAIGACLGFFCLRGFKGRGNI
ncbi:MAG: hypothetical protein MI725_07600 [Pirellulales bacterium]|nr:hypothetical protein [Pirellulales bacterium]